MVKCFEPKATWSTLVCILNVLWKSPRMALGTTWVMLQALLMVTWMSLLCTLNSQAVGFVFFLSEPPPPPRAPCQCDVSREEEGEIRFQACQVCQGPFLWGFQSTYTLDTYMFRCGCTPDLSSEKIRCKILCIARDLLSTKAARLWGRITYRPWGFTE